MRHTRAVLLSLVAIALAACASGPKVEPETDPFVTEQSEFQRTVKIVAIADVQLPDGMPDPQPIEDNIWGLIEAKVRASGFTVVRPQQYKVLWERFGKELGGYVDVETGERNLRNIAWGMAKTLKELDAEFTLDAIIVPEVRVVEAPFGGGRAVWDGTWQSIKAGGVVKNFLSGSPDGTVGALSLAIHVVNDNGTLMYEKSGGIELLSMLEGKAFVLVPRQSLFTDQARIQKAVDIALDPLLAR